MLEKMFAMIPVSDIYVSEDRQRKVFDPDEMARLKQSIKDRETQIQPINVRLPRDGEESGGCKYILWSGGRRLRACKELEFESVECLIWIGEFSEADIQLIELHENVIRDDLTWEEEAAATKRVKQLLEQSNQPSTQKDVATLLGKSEAVVSEELHIAEYLEEVPVVLEGCKNKTEAAKKIAKVEEEFIQKELAKRSEKKLNAKGMDSAKQNLAKGYIIKDAFEFLAKLGQECCDIIDLDPPYGIDYEVRNSGGDGKFVEFDSDDYLNKMNLLARECFRILKDKRWIVCWTSFWKLSETISALSSAGFDVKLTPGIWYKGERQARNNAPECNLAPDYEIFVYARKGAALLTRPGATSVVTYGPDKQASHPTAKPIPLYEHLFSTFANPSYMCICPFLGSGNSILAGSTRGVTVVGTDIVPEYKENFLVRLEEFIANVDNRGKPKSKQASGGNTSEEEVLGL